MLGSWKHLSDKVLLENIERLRTLSQLRGIEIIAVEELKRMPFDLDITESITFKMGEAKGEATGEARGEARLFTRRIERRFGTLPSAIAQRISEATIDQIETWDDREATAQSLDEIFN